MKHHYSLLLLCGLSALSVNAEVTLQDVMGSSQVHLYYISDGSDGTTTAQWKQLTTDGKLATQWTDFDTSQGNVMRSGWVRNGLLCGFAKNYMGQGLSTAFGYVERGLYDGDMYKSEYVSYQDSQFRNTMENAVYNPADDTIYGFGVNPETYMMSFATAPGSGDMTQTKLLYDLSDPYEWGASMCIDSEEGNILVISYGQDTSSVYRYTLEGKSKRLATLPIKNSVDASALAYFPETGYLLWNAVTSEGSALYAVTLDGECTKVLDLPATDRVAYFVTGDLAALASHPATPDFLYASFDKGALTGKVTFRLPSMTLATDPLSGTLQWEATLDGEALASGSGEAGQEVTIDLSVPASGLYTVAMKASNDKGESPLGVKRLPIGHDTPKKADNISMVRNADGTLSASWSAVTEGVNEGYVDLSDMKYEVSLDGTVVATTSKTSWTGEVDASHPLAAHYLSVTAICSGQRGDSSRSNPVVYGAPLELPVHFAPTEAEAPVFTTIADEGAEWHYNDSYDPPAFSSGAHYDDTYVDTWLIMPAINFPDADRYYSLSYEVFTTSGYYTEEAYEVYLGKAPTYEAMTHMVQDVVNPTTVYPAYDSMQQDFTVPEAGVWYIGFHCLSAPKQWGVMLRNFNVEKTDKAVNAVKGVSDTAPRFHTSQGALQYTVAQPTTLKIHTLDGRLVSRTTVYGTGSIQLPSGLYLLTTPTHRVKVMVK